MICFAFIKAMLPGFRNVSSHVSDLRLGTVDCVMHKVIYIIVYGTASLMDIAF